MPSLAHVVLVGGMVSSLEKKEFALCDLVRLSMAERD